MFIFKVAKYVVGFFAGIALGLVGVYILFSGTFEWMTSAKSDNDTYRSMVECYEMDMETKDGERVTCPVCLGNGPITDFEKVDGFVFCSPAHETAYWKMVESYNNDDPLTSKSVLRCYGKRMD